MDEEIERIYPARGRNVILDTDLARLFGTTVKRLLEQVKRNKKRFPEDFAFQLEREEFAALRSQSATSKRGRGGRRYLPWVFTEHGVLMAANVLNSPIAVEASIRIVRAFVRMREALAENKELAVKFGELESKVTKHDAELEALFETIRQLLHSATGTRREIGFHVKDSGKGI